MQLFVKMFSTEGVRWSTTRSDYLEELISTWQTENHVRVAGITLAVGAKDLYAAVTYEQLPAPSAAQRAVPRARSETTMG